MQDKNKDLNNESKESSPNEQDAVIQVRFLRHANTAATMHSSMKVREHRWTQRECAAIPAKVDQSQPVERHKTVKRN